MVRGGKGAEATRATQTLTAWSMLSYTDHAASIQLHFRPSNPGLPRVAGRKAKPSFKRTRAYGQGAGRGVP